MYLNCVEVAGLDYEKVWYKVRPSYLPLESKTMVSKTLLLEIIKKNMNKRSFYLRYKNT